MKLRILKFESVPWKALKICGLEARRKGSKARLERYHRKTHSISQDRIGPPALSRSVAGDKVLLYGSKCRPGQTAHPLFVLGLTIVQDCTRHLSNQAIGTSWA
ncbi:hypothetical protein J6590_034386 [Homalodisca vitripennis]|nr:hypothetical protein J6590_034386 [Homalodisca vitripennis]